MSCMKEDALTRKEKMTEDQNENSQSTSKASNEEELDAKKEEEILEVNLMKEEFEEFEYELPSFDGLAEDFDIEKAYEKDTSFLLREVRKIMMEKLSAYLQLFETFMNPSSPPMFVFSALRALEKEDREMIKRMYKDLSKYQLWAVKLDTVYNEQKEAEFILESYNNWQKFKEEIYKLIEKLEVEQEENSEELKGGYLN